MAEQSSSSSDPAPPPAATSASNKLTFFDISQADALVANEKWADLEKYLSELISVQDSEDVHKMHPGLFIIPFEEQILLLIREGKFDEASSFFESSIKPLLDCKSEYRQFDLNWRVDNLSSIIRMRSPHLERSSTKEIQIAISDYFRLYFPDTIRPKNQVNENSLWQFVMVLEAPSKADDGSKLPKSRSRPSFRCLACQWVAADQSIASIRYHYANTKSRKGCPSITQHLINRLNAVGVYLNLEELMVRGNKKWKQPLASVAPQFVPSVDAAGGVDTVGGILQKVEAARAISSSLLDLLASYAPDIDRTKIVEKLREQKAILQELKSDFMTPSLELSPAPQLPISCKTSAPSKEISSSPQLPLPISSKGSVPSKEPSPAPQLFLPVSSKASGNFDTLFGGLGNLFPEENFDEESMEYLDNICLQTIPEEQLEQSYPEFFPPSPSTQS